VLPHTVIGIVAITIDAIEIIFGEVIMGGDGVRMLGTLSQLDFRLCTAHEIKTILIGHRESSFPPAAEMLRHPLPLSNRERRLGARSKPGLREYSEREAGVTIGKP